MSNEIFESVPHWSFNEGDKKAKKALADLLIEECSKLPKQYKSNKILSLFKQIQQTKLYAILKSMPKGVMHHVHFDCCEDQQFYEQHVITDPIVYLNKDLNGFELGTQSEAEKGSWVSMKNAMTKFEDRKAFVKHVANITMLSKSEISKLNEKNSSQRWELFEKKIMGFFPILGATHLFKKYTLHVLRKYVKNGYDRLQFRALLTNLNQYNEAGQLVKTHEKIKFMQLVDEAYNIVKKQHPSLSIGFIFFGLKFLKPQQNEKLLTEVLEQKWEKTIGIDFVQQQDPFGSQVPYDQIATRVLSKFPEQKHIKKVYHSGQTKDHLNQNVSISIKAGSARIGHGINILQHPQLIDVCRENKICLQQCPVSNMILGYVNDPRNASSQLLLGLGVPVSISPDDPARFGLEDSTMDFFIPFVSSNWNLKHLKLLALHSINHALCSKEQKDELAKVFNQRWDDWLEFALE